MQPESGALSRKILSAFPRFNSFELHALSDIWAVVECETLLLSAAILSFIGEAIFLLTHLRALKSCQKKRLRLCLSSGGKTLEVMYFIINTAFSRLDLALYARSNYRASRNRFCIAIRNVSLFKLNIKRSRFKVIVSGKSTGGAAWASFIAITVKLLKVT